MKVTLVSERPTPAAEAAGRPALTPELIAATGARYSRNDEGLEAILAKIDLGNERETLGRFLDCTEGTDTSLEEYESRAQAYNEIRTCYRPGNLEQGVDSIFRMVDYGHASIADMADAKIFMDGLSLQLIYWIWSQCPTGAGQETSTRYCKFNSSGLISPELLGIAPEYQATWYQLMNEAFAAYHEAYDIWLKIAQLEPSVIRIPGEIQARAVVGDEKAKKTVERMRRNYAFDRARYWIPMACRNNMMLKMSARSWVELIQKLLSSPWPEAVCLGEQLIPELGLVTPRLIKHATAKDYWKHALVSEIDRACPANFTNQFWHQGQPLTAPSDPYLQLMLPCGIAADKSIEHEYVQDLAFHENRYGPVGPFLRRTAVRYGWGGMAIAELRDMNRMRPGNKHWTPVPNGFYFASDQLPVTRPHYTSPVSHLGTRLTELAEIGRVTGYHAYQHLSANNPSYAYWTLLGTQYPFEHLTTGDKFLYTMELRTGTGTHFRYAAQCREILELWYARFPATRGVILEGSSEPE